MSFQNKILIILKNYKNIFENILSLSILNFFNTIIPLIAIPYMIKVLGFENFGIYSVFNTIIVYILLFTNFGFNISATKVVSINRINLNYINLYFSSVLIIRLILTFLSIFLLFIITFFIHSLNFNLCLYSLGILIADIFIPIWFFQGQEQMKYITILYSIQKILFTIFIFVFIKEKNSYPIIFLINSITMLFLSLVAILILYKKFKIRFLIPQFDFIKDVFKSSKRYFLTTLGITFYRNINILVLGFTNSNFDTGIYAASEKIVKSFQSIVFPFTNAIFPYYSFTFTNNNLKTNIKLLEKVTILYFIIFLFFNTILFIFSKYISNIVVKEHIYYSTILIRIMSFVILFGGLNYLLGIVGLINLGYENKFNKSVFYTAIINIILIFVLSYYYSFYGAAISFTLSELFLFILLFFNIYKLKRN